MIRPTFWDIFPDFFQAFDGIYMPYGISSKRLPNALALYFMFFECAPGVFDF